jgi:hypothetical protein
MKRTSVHCLWATLSACYLAACTPLAVTPQTAEEKQRAYEKERFAAKVVFDPATPQAISGFFRLGRVASDNISNTDVLTRVGNLRDLEMIAEIVNQYTEVRAEITPSITYSDPRLFDLPIIIPQSPPNEVELQQLTNYLLNGGFAIDASLGFDAYREGLEKYGELVWGRDAWVGRVPDGHPVFSTFFDINLEENMLPSPTGMQGLFVDDRLVVISFAGLGVQDEREIREENVRELGSDEDRSAVTQLDEKSVRAINEARISRFSSMRFQQMTVNAVIFALTQRGSIARKTAQ